MTDPRGLKDLLPAQNRHPYRPGHIHFLGFKPAHKTLITQVVSTSINLKNKSAGCGCRDKTIEKTILGAFRARTFSRGEGQDRQQLMVFRQKH